jgi:hypothetical protein
VIFDEKHDLQQLSNKKWFEFPFTGEVCPFLKILSLYETMHFEAL